MNKIKKMLIDASNEQKIHDLDKEILSKVDTSKVIITKKNKRKINYPLLGRLILTFSMAGLILFLGFSLGKINRGSNIVNNNSNITPIDKDEIISESLILQMDEIEAFETYNLVNIANNFNDIKFGNITLNEDKSMTSDAELMLASDLNSFMHNIEGMFKIENIIAERSNNINPNYADYEFDNKVKCSYFEYHLYMNEYVLEEKNVGKENYKLNTVYMGIINVDDTDYDFSGNMIIKNGYIEYTSKISLDDNKYVSIKEKFGTNNGNKNEYTYEYSYDDNKKYIKIEENFKDNDIDNIYFINGIDKNNEFDKVTLRKGDGVLIGDIKSHNNDSITISKDTDLFLYQFKNSNNIYEF